MNLSPHPLLQWLLEKLPEQSLQRSLVVSNSASAAGALRRMLTEMRGAMLGVEFVTVRGLAREVLNLGGRSFPLQTPHPLQEREALRQCLPKGTLGKYVRRYPSALQQLLFNCKELDVLGPLPAGEGLGANGQQVWQAAKDFRQAMAQTGNRECWMRLATNLASKPKAQLPAQVLLVGMARIDPDLQILLQKLIDAGVPVHRSPEPGKQPEPAMFVASNPYLELRHAARQCMQAAQDGTAWQQMVVATANLQSYSLHIQRTFAAEGVPYRSPAQELLQQQPFAALHLHLARLLFGQAPLASYLAWVNSALRRKPIPAAEQLLFEENARKQGLHGDNELLAVFMASFARRLDKKGIAEAASLQCLQELHDLRQSLPAEANMQDFAQQVQGFMQEQCTSNNDELQNTLQENYLGLGHAASDLISQGRFLQEMEELWQSARVALSGQHRQGVQVVTLMDALALPAQHLQIIGLTAEALASFNEQRGLLDEADREALGLPGLEFYQQEQAQVLQQLLGLAATLSLSYHRSDNSGKASQQSLWLQSLAQERELGEGQVLQGHPLTRACTAVASQLAPKDLALACLALQGVEAAEAYEEIAGKAGRRSLLAARQLESFKAEDLSRDGLVGPEFGKVLATQKLSVTDLELLAKCPQKFLFQRGMGLRGLPPAQDSFTLPQDRVGTAIHRCLEQLFKDHLPEMQQEDVPWARLQKEMSKAAGPMLAASLRQDETNLGQDLPEIYGLTLDRWTGALQRYLQQDLQTMQQDQSRPEAMELEVDDSLGFVGSDGQQQEQQFRGRLDRLDKLGNEQYRVVDFKTGAKPEDILTPKKVLTGRSMQLLLYALLLSKHAGKSIGEIEVHGINPNLQGAGEDAQDLVGRAPLKNPEKYLEGKLKDSVQETLGILLRLLREGSFIPQDGECGFCDFRLACRRLHPPSARRIQEAAQPELQWFLRLASKSSKNPDLGWGQA